MSQTNTNHFAGHVGFQYVKAAFKEFLQLFDSEPQSATTLSDQDTLSRLDDEWRIAAESFITLKTKADEAAKLVEHAKEKLIGLSSHNRETGFGVSVTRYWKQGNVDYKAIPQLKSVDLDRYRGSGREEVRVSVIK